MSAVLQVRGLARRFGGIAALDGVDLTFARDEVRCLIGPNGAGKTTLINVLTGLIAPQSGTVRYDGAEISRSAPAAIARLGIVRTFQTPTVFADLSLAVNVELALRRRRPGGGAPLGETPAAILDAIGLSGRGTGRAGDLAHGEKKRLELGMVLATDPTVVLLDEPTAGMSIRETAEIAQLLRGVAAGRALVIVEHDMAFVREMADVVSVLHRGRVLAEGGIDDIERDERVREVYLGDATLC